jgi:hypothetical protein
LTTLVTAPVVKSKTVNIIDGKRSMSMGIFLKQFRKTSNQIIDGLILGDTKLWTLERSKAGRKLFSEESDIEDVKFHVEQNGLEGLPMVELFFYELGTRRGLIFKNLTLRVTKHKNISATKFLKI